MLKDEKSEILRQCKIVIIIYVITEIDYNNEAVDYFLHIYNH